LNLKEKTMNQETMNLNEITIEIEELEQKIAPQSSSGFLD
jgi:hypothetical protein